MRISPLFNNILKIQYNARRAIPDNPIRKEIDGYENRDYTLKDIPIHRE